MISRRLTATIAIPLCALSIAAVALFPVALTQGLLAFLNELTQQVVEPGIVRLSTWVFAVILGAVLAAQMRINGAAERVVRYTAEYAGEDRFKLGLSMLLVIAVLFTTLGGLGAVILVATICLPVLFSLGIERRVAGGIFLLGLSLGGALNPANWQGYKDVLASLDVPAALRLELSNIISFAVIMALLFLAVAAAFILQKLSEKRYVFRNLAGLVISAAALGGLGWVVSTSASLTLLFMNVLATMLGLLIALLCGLLLLRCCLLPFARSEQSWTSRTDNWLAAASLLIPILLLLWTNVHRQLNPESPIDLGILAALCIGIVFCALSSLTRSGRAVNQLMQALFEGVTQAAPAIILLIGIGILLKATMLPDVLSSFAPVFARLPVNSPIAFVASFLVLSPLALYRGPLNLYGMGFGIMGILSGAGVLHGSLIMAAFFSVGMLQGVCDPTNTHNVWIANFCKVPVNELTRLLFPWVSTIVLMGLVAGAVMFHGDFAI